MVWEPTPAIKGSKIPLAFTPVPDQLPPLGVPIKGHVTAARAGHASNVEFVKKLKKKYNKELNILRNKS